MRTIFAVICAIACAGSAFAQSGSTEIPFAPSAGSEWNITEVRTRTGRGEGRDETKVATTRGTLTLIDRTRDGFRANWILNQINADGVTVTDEPQLLIGLNMGLMLDEAGAPVSVDEWPALRAQIFAAMEDITPAAERTESWRRSIATIENLMSQWAPAHAAQMLVPGIAVMSICQGTDLNVGEPVTATTRMPNALGGPPIDATESLTLVSMDRNVGVARLVYTRGLDPESATASIRQTLVNLARDSGRPVEEIEQMFANMTMTHDTRAECVVDLVTGVTRSATHEVIVTMGPVSRSDRREITVAAR
jgi:hypothetical protein